MIPVPTNRYVYMEFSIQATSSAHPSVALGLSPPDCPLNVAVGSWANSIGLFSDSHLTVASRWFEVPTPAHKINTGNTVGMLVFIPSPASQAVSSVGHQCAKKIVGDGHDFSTLASSAISVAEDVHVPSAVEVTNNIASSPNAFTRAIRWVFCDFS